VNQFESSHLFAEIDPEIAAGLLSTAADLALVIDPNGVIQNVQLSNTELPLNDHQSWIGKTWTSTVTSESKPKVGELLRDAATQQNRQWRHINYPSAQGADVPILCSAIPVGKQGNVVAFGRDLRGMAAMQQRLIDAHQAMERDYLRMRHMETRYRLLFELAAEAVLIVDTAAQRVLEANPAAGKLLGSQSKRLIGRRLSDCFTDDYKTTIEQLLSVVLASGDPESRKIPAPKDGDEITVSASVFKQESGTLFLVRLTPGSMQAEIDARSPQRSMSLEVLEHSPDGFVVTDAAGKILTVNQAFTDMAQLTKAEQLLGLPLARWLGRSDIDLSVLIANLQQRGSVRLFATTLRGAGGAEIQVEISAVSVTTSPVPCLGFCIREVGQRASTDRSSLRQLPRSADQLVELVGRVPLQEIVSETADLIEKLCIEAALKLTRDNRASASEMLGLSRQSLYVKLRRYGIGEVSERSKK